MNGVYKLLDKFKGYTTVFGFIMMSFGGLTQFPNNLKLAFIYIGMGIIYLTWLKDSIKWATSIPKIIIWLFIAPALISIVVIAYISLFWDGINSDFVFSLCFLILFIFIWILAVLKFDKRKIKIATGFVNATTSTVLALSFIIISGIKPDAFAELFSVSEVVVNNYTVETILNILIKTVTLPYLLGGIWGNLVLEARYGKG